MINTINDEIFKNSIKYITQVRFIVKDFFANTHVNNFMYLRGSQDGSMIILLSEMDPLMNWLKSGFTILPYFDKDYRYLQTYSYWWVDKHQIELECLVRDNSFQNGFSIVRRYPNYFEEFGFADSITQPLQASTCMSCFADFENFSDYFVRAAKYIINDASRNPVILPAYPTMLTPAEYCLGKNSKQLIAKGFFGDVQISTYEYYSLQLLLKGNSYKEIGRILSVSHKTIEKYLSNFKRQTGYNPRDISFVQESDGIVEFICAIKGNSEKVV